MNSEIVLGMFLDDNQDMTRITDDFNRLEKLGFDFVVTTDAEYIPKIKKLID